MVARRRRELLALWSNKQVDVVRILNDLTRRLRRSEAHELVRDVRVFEFVRGRHVDGSRKERVSNAAVYPGRAERCTDSIDNNCDGRINEGCADPEPDPECTSGTTTSSCYSCAVSRTDSLTGNSDPALQSYDDSAPGSSQIRACPSGYCSCVQRCVGGRWSGCNGGVLAPRTGPVPE
ncbi:putative metal-binding motif-containing protein [Sorangium sp. So ce321]|uniref:putative metal-binding motif-containing protein n=1 Tax=Sorangium sp. So ce321 TaxID=3133300 RepID=UPI003F6486F4